MARRIRMPADERRQELIETATQLFMEKGYKNVSVQDILEKVDGQNGMFYHHFKSKDEIYNAAIDLFIDKAAEARLKVINNKTLSLTQRLEMIFETISNDVSSFNSTFGVPVDFSFLAKALDGFIEVLVVPCANAIMDAKNDGTIPESTFITDENVEAVARFILHGSNGLVRKREEKDSSNSDAENVVLFIHEFLHIPYNS